MAKPYVTGPAHMFTGFNRGANIFYLGTAESAPDVTIKTEWDQVMNDLSGSRLSWDDLWEGEEGYVSATLTRWNWPVLAQMMTRPVMAGGVAGAFTNKDIGSAWLTEGLYFTFYIQFPYQQLKNAIYGDMPPGVKFLACKLLGPESLSPGTKAKKVNITIHAKRLFAQSLGQSGSVNTNPAGVVGAGQLYDIGAAAMAGLPAIN